MTEIYLIRHVQAEGNLFHVMQGHWDGAVTKHGVEQRDRLERRFSKIPVDAVWSSDLTRTRFTASAVSRSRRLPVQLDTRLREMNVGPWEARPIANVAWENPAAFEAFIRDQEHFSLPGAETFRQVQARAMEALREIAQANDGRTVAVVSHGLTIRCILAEILGLPLNDRDGIPFSPNSGVTHLFYDGERFRADLIGDASHLSLEEQGPPLRGVSLRHSAVDPHSCRELYIDCYADSWRSAHGDLLGFDGELYWLAACEHFHADPEAVTLLYDGETFAGLLDLDPVRASHIDCAWVSLLYLRPEYRGQGLGIQAMWKAVEFCRRHHRKALRLYVAEDNKAGLAFYRKWGFTKLSWTQGSKSKLWLMEKPLEGGAHAGF